MTQSRTVHRTRGVVFRILGTVLTLIGALIVAGIAFAVARGVGAGETAAGVVALTAMGVALLMFALVLRSTLPPHEQRLMVASHTGWRTTIAVALGLALAARIGVGAITVIAEQIDPSLRERLEEIGLEPTPELWQKIAVAVALVVLAPLGEELLFRAILLRGLVRVMPFPGAAVVSGAVFGAAHLQYWQVWPVLVGVTLFGIANCYVYRRYGFRTAVLAHALFNAVVAVLLFVDLPVEEPGNR